MRSSGPPSPGPAAPSSGGVQTTLAATASWPSRNTVAVIGTCSPTTARAENDPQDTTGAASVMPRRRSGRPVIADHASEDGDGQHLGAVLPPVGATVTGGDGASRRALRPAGGKAPAR